MRSPSRPQHTTHRTAVLLDPTLVERARNVLGTVGTTETIRRALSEVVARDQRRQLASWDLGDMTLDDLDQIRHARAAE